MSDALTLAMARAQVAWARRYAPWLLPEELRCGPAAGNRPSSPPVRSAIGRKDGRT